MADLITLACPSCGGKLKVSKNANSLTCQHCGNEHMVKHEAGGILLEAYARCPVCGRNDKSEKVSAVLASQTQEISGTEQKQEVMLNAQGQQQVVTRDVPFTRRQVTVLGQRLAPPPPLDPSHFPPYPRPPQPPSRGGGIALIVIGAVIVITSVICGLLSFPMFAMAADPYYGSSDSALTGLIFIIGAAFLFLLGGGLAALGIFLAVRAGKPDPNVQARYQQQVEAVKQEHARIIKNYERAVERWNNLYYCARDDCIFVPGEHSSAPVNKIKEYLFSPESLPPTR